MRGAATSAPLETPLAAWAVARAAAPLAPHFSCIALSAYSTAAAHLDSSPFVCKTHLGSAQFVAVAFPAGLQVVAPVVEMAI
jgi:hypothetical protein